MMLGISFVVNNQRVKPLDPCSSRTYRQVEAECNCGTYKQMFCTKLNLPVGDAGCRKCQADPDWLNSQLLKGE